MFENEYTWGKAVSQGKENEFHNKFDDAVDRVKKKFGKQYPCIINGKEIFSENTFDVRSPSDTRLVLGTFPKLDESQTKKAISSAKNAFEKWSSLPYQKRSDVLKQTADEFSKIKFELAAWMSFENGKTRVEAINDVDEAIDFMRFYSFQLEKNEGFCKQTPHPNPHEKTKTVLKPYGVWGIIAPFNFPSAIAIGMTTGALLTGNTAVLKPASATPLSSYFFVDSLVGKIPQGAINFVTGDGDVVGKTLIESNDVDGIAFTGSQAVGMSGFKKFTEKTSKPYIAEMGGKNPVIITKNADLDKASEGVMRAAFGFGGQKCSACSRVYVQKDVSQEFLKKLVEKSNSLKIGMPWNRETFLGPVINNDSVSKFQNAVSLAKKDGKIIFGGNKIADSEHQNGYFVQPTIVTDLPKDHKLVTEELFLPFLCIDTYDDFDQAIALANKSEYGLTAGIFSEDKNQVNEFFEKIQAGTVYANRESSATTAALVQSQPFVGWKSSGITGKGAGGEYYLQQFMRSQTQTLCD
ncbi:aldehyde dehydrogenase family protein [Nitrosopumilus sp. K4]|uniref:aldehyde dehydrogenase family protein n=1 Tax=Nitrosopumilus sp. K4 TaxID=2795383 RepID=UPI001BAACD44|nr:aldehyde dehydrogenase family protein [Nitrosopumilus sp. K4]QUC64144.1 aldehyde dehydrogenase family protein [Nitrosopumilus sp. K4]